MKNVNMGMKVENLRVVEFYYVNDTCLKRGGNWAWSDMMENKTAMKNGENKIIYHVKVNNGYEKNVVFKIAQITIKATNVNDPSKNIRHYTEVVIEDIDGIFGKIICSPNDIRNANNTLKNKLTDEYRKTYAQLKQATEQYRQDNIQCGKIIQDQQAKIKATEKQLKEQLDKRLEDNEKITNLTMENMELENTNHELTVKNENLQNEIMVLTQRLNENATKTFNHNEELEKFSNIPSIVKTAIKLYERGFSVDAIINKIAKRLKK